MRVLVTGADGFAGRHVVELLVQAGHKVWAGCRPGGEPAKSWLGPQAQKAVTVIPLEITDPTSVSAALGRPFEAIVHLAAVASGSEARRDPGRAWVVNAAGTARLVDAAVVIRGKTGVDPLLLVVSSAEVYGNGPAVPRVETDPLVPQSPYAASKVGTEVAALEAWRREGLRVVIARAFPAHRSRAVTRLCGAGLSRAAPRCPGYRRGRSTHWQPRSRARPARCSRCRGCLRRAAQPGVAGRSVQRRPRSGRDAQGVVRQAGGDGRRQGDAGA